MKRKWRFSLRTLILLPLLVAIGIIAFDLFGVYDNSTWALISNIAAIGISLGAYGWLMAWMKP